MFKALGGKGLRTSRAAAEFHHEGREDHEEKNPWHGGSLLNPNSDPGKARQSLAPPGCFPKSRLMPPISFGPFEFSNRHFYRIFKPVLLPHFQLGGPKRAESTSSVGETPTDATETVALPRSR